MYNYEVASNDVTKMGLTEFVIWKSKLTFFMIDVSKCDVTT